MLAGFLAGAAHANLISNPGFETGDLTGWTADGWDVTEFLPHSGGWSAFTVCVGSQCTDPASPFAAFLYQDVTTVAGSAYSLSFWFNTGDFATEGSELLVLWDGVQVADFLNVDTSTVYQFAMVPNLTATGPTTRLQFFGRQDPSVLLLDDVDMEQVAASVPEPEAIVLIPLGLLLFRLTRILRT
jgi:hypothetical protein